MKTIYYNNMSTIEEKSESIWIKITEQPLDDKGINDWSVHPSGGSVVHFHGTTRDHFEDKIVTYLEYESDVELALTQLKEIIETCMKKFDGILKIALHHRLERVNVGEISVICSVTSKHRKEGFEACSWLMTDLKSQVAIWKKEYFDDGQSIWKENTEQFNLNNI